MDSRLLRHHSTSSLRLLQSTVNPSKLCKFFSITDRNFGFAAGKFSRRTPIVAANHCQFSSLNVPLEPRSPAGRYLSSVLQNHPQLFHISAAEELKIIADDREDAVSRMVLRRGSDEACLHRRIAELKVRDCQLAVEDVIYMLVFYKFSSLKVPLVPKLSSCIYNGRLEIWPSKDWELESIHSFEVLEMIKEHVTAVIGLRANSSVSDTWATTKIQRFQLGRIYAASILYGYFLKSALLRHRLEHCIALSHEHLSLNHRTSIKFPDRCSKNLKNNAFGHSGSTHSRLLGQESIETKQGGLKCYVMGFDTGTLQRCAKLKSTEAMSLVEKHTRALFGEDEKMGVLGSDEVIVTSFSSLKRLILEAVAFGSFLWDVEDYVGSVYELKEN